MKFRMIAVGAAVVMAFGGSVAAAPQRAGSFTKAFQRDNQPHRTYFQVTAEQGSKDCAVTLAQKTLQVSLGTDKLSDVTYIWYVHPRMAKRALNQALATDGEPTQRILCGH